MRSGFGMLPPAQHVMTSQAQSCVLTQQELGQGLLPWCCFFYPCHRDHSPVGVQSTYFPPKQRRFTFGNTLLLVTSAAAASLLASLLTAVCVTSLTWFQCLFLWVTVAHTEFTSPYRVCIKCTVNIQQRRGKASKLPFI